MKQLAEARAALERGEEARALDTLVDGWRESRSAVIARAAEALSKRLEPHLPPIDGKLEEFQPLWLAIAKQQRAVDLPRLLRSVLHGSNRFGVAVVNALAERGQALAEWPADPRASVVVVEYLQDPGYTTTSKSTYPFWSAMFKMLETNADPRVLERLEKLKYAHVFRHITDKAKRIAWFQGQLDATVARLREREVDPLTKAVNERATKLVQLIGKRGKVAPDEIARIAQPPKVPAKPVRAAAPVARLDAKAGRTQLDAALRALKSGDDPAALRALVEAWRATRAVQLAELVERVSDRYAARLVPIAGQRRADVQREWLATVAEQRIEDLPRLLASITDTGGRSTDALARVNALASWPSDPRTAAAVLRTVERPLFYASSTRPFWKAMIQLVVDHQDPRAVAALDALAKRFNLRSTYQDMSSTNAWFKNQLKTAANQLRDRAVPGELDAQARKTCDAIAAQLETESALLAEIYANPDDDHPREVYADVLQQRGDPRGDFIALQLAGNTERADELLSRYAKTWLGPLARVLYLDECRFERGFLARARLFDDMNDNDLAPLIGNPLWSTVTHVDLGDMRKAPEQFLAQPALANAEDQRRSSASPSTATSGN